MQDKLVKYSNKSQGQSFIIPSSQEKNWKENFSKLGINEDISSYQREESDYFQVAGPATAGTFGQTQQSSQHQSGSRTTS